MNLVLPKNQRRSFEALGGLDTARKDRLYEVLQAEPLSVKLGDLASKYAPELGLDENSALGILWMLHHMYSARIEHKLSAAEFAEGISGGARSAELKLTEAEIDAVKEFLVKALSLNDTLGVVAKGIGLLRNRERIFTDCQIITDFRPIFRESLDDAPSAAVIIHNLRLTFNDDGESVSLYVGLDTSDLESLKACVERALQKEAGLKKTLAVSIPCVT